MSSATRKSQKDIDKAERGLFRDPRILLFIAAILLSAWFIHPGITDGKLTSNLRYGLDLEGGTWIQLQLEGEVVTLDADMGKIIQQDFSTLLNDNVTVTGTSPTKVTFTTTRPVSKKTIESFGYGAANISGNTVSLAVNKPSAIVAFLGNNIDGEIIFLGSDTYEIRKDITKDELNILLASVGGQIEKNGQGEDLYSHTVVPETLELTKTILNSKLNAFGLLDVPMRTVGDNIILIDLAGTDMATAQNLVAKPGKFEIRVYTTGNDTRHVLYGEDITSVGVPRERDEGIWGIDFSVNQHGAIALRDAAYETGATDDPINHEVAMYLDGKQIFSAPLANELAANLKQMAVNKVAVGSQSFVTTTGAGEVGEAKAKELQIHLREGALPVAVKIIGSGQVPAKLGAQFRIQSLIAGLFALLMVSFVVFLRYHQKGILIPMLATSVSEVFMILGFASLVGWQLDLASIAGIIAVIGTGIDHLVIITDEVLYEGSLPPTKVYLSRISKAFGIIMAAAATTIVAMLPLVFMGFGSLKGFAITTIVGVLIGVLIARPAYGRVIKEVLE